LARTSHGAGTAARHLSIVSPSERLRQGWTVELRLIYDADQAFGWITGSAWSADGAEVLEMPDADITGSAARDDVIALLGALWTAKQATEDRHQP
jgi:hypothetical protein